MEPEQEESAKKEIESEKLKLIQWEDYEQEAARLWSLSSALKEAEGKKLSLKQKLNAFIQVKAESLSRLNELVEMREKLEARKSALGSISARTKVSAEVAKNEEESLSMEVRSLLVASTALSVSSKQHEESKKLVSREKGYGHLRNLQKKLRMRQQYMVGQVSLLYPVKITAGPSEEQELEAFPSTAKSGNYCGSKPTNQESLTIFGLHLMMLPFTKMNFFTNKKEIQISATALGYVAHAILHIASYLEVPLRYPVHLGGSRSYISDYASLVEPTSSELLLSLPSFANNKSVQFPLFLEGQDTTRAAYAIFLLNKDLEQLLNFVGVESLGPRYVLANLKELTRTILSAEFLET